MCAPHSPITCKQWQLQKRLKAPSDLELLRKSESASQEHPKVWGVWVADPADVTVGAATPLTTDLAAACLDRSRTRPTGAVSTHAKATS